MLQATRAAGGDGLASFDAERSAPIVAEQSAKRSAGAATPTTTRFVSPWRLTPELSRTP